ncbi:hypothetical protein DY000_02060320 [Brassica cretica]|uniref:Retrotransposon gag domain-containing protein n=1 Tax=Brassica cretica TaxID=69181 RepID=A0ABQ7B263_BRACR|nr:hypothetical protein DY000_02060320 [Brassica cretica]
MKIASGLCWGKYSKRATRSYPKRSRAPKATRWSTNSSNRAAQCSRRGCGESRALLISQELEGEARRTFQATGAERREPQPARIREPNPLRRKPSPQHDNRDLEKTSDGLYEKLQHRVEPLRGYIARFNEEKVGIPECNIPTAISAFKRGFLPDRDLYKELTKYQWKTMEDVLSRAWAHVKWEEDVASCAKAQQKQDTKAVRPDQNERDERPSPRHTKDSGNRSRGRYQNRPIEKAEGMVVSTWPDISHLSISKPELVNVLRQMGQQDRGQRTTQERTPPRVSFREGQEPSKQRDIRKAHLSCSVTSTGPSDPRDNRRLRIQRHKSCPREEEHLERQAWPRGSQPKGLLLGMDEISFTAKEQEKVLAPHHDALVISLTVKNCLVKKIMVDNGSSSNIIFQAAYRDLGLEESTLIRRITHS